MMKSKSNRVSFRAVFAWLLIIGLLFELSIRLITAWWEPTEGFTWMLGSERLSETTERDLHRMFTGKKGQRVEYGPISIDFNDLGYRSSKREIPPKGEGVFRVVCFGDSVTFGAYEHDYEGTWPGAMEEILRGLTWQGEIEVLNFGMNHYTVATNLMNLSLLGEYLQPDLVIYLFGPNDITSLYLRGYAVDGSHENPFVFPILDAVWGFHPLIDILKHSRVCNFLYVCATKFVLLMNVNKTFNFQLSQESILDRLETMSLHISTFCSLSRSLGATPVICAPVYDRERLVKARGNSLDPLIETMEGFFGRLGRAQETIVIEAQDQMKDVHDSFRDDFHLNTRGARQFAEIMIRELNHHNLLPEGSVDLAARRKDTESPRLSVGE